MEDKIIRINIFYNLITNDLGNDYFLFPFMELVIELLLEFKLISDKGMSILSRDIQEEFDSLNSKSVRADTKDKARMVICLYFMCIYHLSKFYTSFIEILMLQDGGKYGELRNQLDAIDSEILVKLIDVKERALPFIDIAKKILDKEQNNIEDETQAKMFDEHKRKCIEKPNFFQECPLYVPAEMPEGV
jgi:hypothetical protein